MMAGPAALRTEQIAREVHIPLGMAHLAVQGLSEDWWLKFLGDVHWQLIADAVGQRTTVFRDSQGRQMYAAFCATQFEQLRPDLAQLGQSLRVRSNLWSGGRSRIQSNHRLELDGIEIAQFRLVSTFVVHQQTGVNASVSRATPYLIPILQSAPDSFAQETAATAKQLRADRSAPVNQVELYTAVGSDFNAVGLLYFPSYTRLLDQAQVRLERDTAWSPVRRRDVFYFGNIEQGESVIGAACTQDTLALYKRRSEAQGGIEKIAHCACVRFRLDGSPAFQQ